MPIAFPVFVNAFLMAGVLVFTGCVEREPLSPTGDPFGEILASSDPVPTEGCAVFTVDVSDPRKVVVEESVDAECGPVHPVLGGEAAFDAADLVLRLPIAIENGSSTPLEDPAYLHSNDNLLEVVGGDEEEEGLLLFLNADSTHTGLADEEGLLRYTWRYDDLLPEEDGSAFMKPGERSDVRWIEIAVDPTVDRFRVGFHAHAIIPAGWEGRSYVPEVPPDTIPGWIYQSENHVYYTSGQDTIARYTKNVMVIQFEFDATREERQAAVDAINGEVIGGSRWLPNGEGPYYVRFESDGTLEAMSDARNAVNTQPTVMSATLVETVRARDAVHYLRPNDGPGFRRDDWSRDPARASGTNWGLEAIAAPMAWGCSTGSPARIGVVDYGFQAVDDIQPNVGRLFGVGIYDATDISQNHGTQVAALIGARGDSDDGITGAMWLASLGLYEITVDALGFPLISDDPGPVFEPRNVGARIVQAGLEGAAVINLSLGAPWPRGYQPGTDTDNARFDRERAEEWMQGARDAVRFLHNFDRYPLLVTSAGNNSVDATWNGMGHLSIDFPDQVLTVGNAVLGASTDPRDPFSLATSSSRNITHDAVEIAAPGDGTHSLDGEGRLHRFGGTSAAAAHVSGVAGLLFSFDPRLSTADVKRFILDGANRGDRDADGIPLLNAYESLRAAAERPGAPLCGNRVWAEGRQIYAQRGSGREALGPPEAQYPPFAVAPVHGGKHIRYQTIEGVKALGWVRDASAAQWEPSGLPAGYVRGGTDASVHGYEVVYDDAGNPSLTNPWDIGALGVDYEPKPVRRPCIERSSGGWCSISLIENRAWIFRLGYPQNGGDAYLTVSPIELVPTDSTEWRTCSYDEGLQCRDVRMSQQYTGTRVYRMAVPSGNAQPVAQLEEGGAVFWLGQGEQEPALVLGRGVFDIYSWYDPEHFHRTGDPVRERHADIETCGIEYRDPHRFALQERIETPNACSFENVDYPSYAGGGTISPSVVGRTGTFSLDDSTSETVSLTARIVGFNGSAFEEIR